MGKNKRGCPIVECGGGCTDGETGTRSEHIQGCVSCGKYRRPDCWELSTWDIVELLVVEYVREVLGVDLGRVAVDLDARRGLAGQYPHPERQLLALKG